MKNVPLVDLRGQYEPLMEEVQAAMAEVLDGMKLFLGENVFALERDFAALCGARHAIGVGSGTDAIYLALTALDIGHGDEVITAPNSFIASAAAIAMTGATPVFADIDAETYTIDPEQVDLAVTPRTKAILPVHLYGQPADMGALKQVTDTHKLAIVEDACQAHGAEYRGQRTGTLGDAAAFSFYYSKNPGAYGEGGAVVTNNRSLATKVQLLRNHGSAQRYHHSVLGMNSRLDELQAAVLRIKLRYLESWNIKRRALALEYNKRLSLYPDVVTPVERADATHVYHLYVIRVPYRDELLEWLNRHGVGAAIHYPVPIHMQEATRYLGYGSGDFPVTEQVTSEIISLPIYPELGIDDVNYICQTIGDFWRARRGKRPDTRRRRSAILIPEHYLRIAKKWAWLIAAVTAACVGIAVLIIPGMVASGPPGNSAATTLGVTRLVSASGSVTTAGGTGTPQLLSNYTQSVADRGNTPQFQKELQDRLAAQGVIIPSTSLAKKVSFKSDVGLFRVAVIATDASSTQAQLIADTAVALMIDDISAEETRVKTDLTATTNAQQTQLLAQLNDVYTKRTAQLALVGEPAIRTALDDLVRSGVGQDPSKSFTSLVADLARIGSDPTLAVLNSQATSLEQQLAALADTQRSFSDQILQGKPLSIVNPTTTVQLAPSNSLRTRDLALMGLVAGIVLGWIAAAAADGFVAGWKTERARKEEWETVNTDRIDRYFSHD